MGRSFQTSTRNDYFADSITQTITVPSPLAASHLLLELMGAVFFRTLFSKQSLGQGSIYNFLRIIQPQKSSGGLPELKKPVFSKDFIGLGNLFKESAKFGYRSYAVNYVFNQPDE